MSVTDNEFTKLQLEFLDLFQIAAKYDCLYVLDFHCDDLFDHCQISLLTDYERALVARAARREVFSEAVEKGYEPPDAKFLYGDGNGFNGPLC